MKSLLVILSSVLLCSCATMVVSHTDVATAGGGVAAPTDAKDVGSGVHMTTNCGVGASNPQAIYVRPFCIDNSVFQGDEASSDGEMPIRKALSPVELAEDMKQELERIAPVRKGRPVTIKLPPIATERASASLTGTAPSRRRSSDTPSNCPALPRRGFLFRRRCYHRAMSIGPPQISAKDKPLRRKDARRRRGTRSPSPRKWPSVLR